MTIFKLLALSFQHLTHIPPARMPFHIRFILSLELAIELPIIFAFHPSMILKHSSISRWWSRSPSFTELSLQTAVFLATEVLFQQGILRYITFMPDQGHANSLVGQKEERPLIKHPKLVEQNR